MTNNGQLACAVSTEVSTCPLYVDPAGDDTNLGFASFTPKRTLEAALTEARKTPFDGHTQVINMAAGSYPAQGNCDQYITFNVVIRGAGQSQVIYRCAPRVMSCLRSP